MTKKEFKVQQALGLVPTFRIVLYGPHGGLYISGDIDCLSVKEAVYIAFWSIEPRSKRLKYFKMFLDRYEHHSYYSHCSARVHNIKKPNEWSTHHVNNLLQRNGNMKTRLSRELEKFLKEML